MKARIAILAALPREIEPLISNWPVRSASRRQGTLIAECDQAIAVCAGMGAERVEQALLSAESRGPLSEVLSVGYAGALCEGILRNTIHWPATVVDAATEQRYECIGGSGTLLTISRVLGREDKAQMASRWTADLVDMEAARVALLAQTRGLPFRALRVVSDEVDDMLPDLNRFVDDHSGFRKAAFAGYLVVHPSMIPATIRLGRTSSFASRVLAQELRKVLERAE